MDPAVTPPPDQTPLPDPTPPPDPTPLRRAADLVAGVRAGRPRAVARVLSLIESPTPLTPVVIAALVGEVADHHVVGLTGAPGVGKSTTTAALALRWREVGHRVGVLAVDPSSPFTGGALLGDRIRMQQLTTDPDVVIRSMATRGHLGGLAVAAPSAVRVLALAGCARVAVETVGVGQSEVEVAGVCDTTVVLLAPGMGDGVQTAKAGLLEVGDVFVVNKADRDGVQPLVRELRGMIAGGRRGEQDWKPPIVTTVASTGQGVDELADVIEAHRRHGVADGSRDRRRSRRAREEVVAHVTAELRRRLLAGSDGERLSGLADEVAAGRTDAASAARTLWHGLGRD